MIPFLPALIIACQILSVFSGRECQDSGKCKQHLGSMGICHNKLCGCVDHYYLSRWDENNSNGSCTQCPGIGESCAEMQCCNTRYLDCENNVCVCFNSEYCWDIDDAQRDRFQRIAQCILAAALILTGTILLVLFWRTCSRSVRTIAYMGYLAPVTRRREIQEALQRDRFPSLNSIQRFVLLQLQDRPPPYSHDCLHWKYASDITEPPPSYIEAIGLSDQSGEDNLVFVLGEEAFRRLSANSLLIAMSTGLTLENNLETPQGVPFDTSTLASTSQNPESQMLTGSTTGSGELSHMSMSLSAENNSSEIPQGVQADRSALASTSGDPESYQLTRSNSGSSELSQFQGSDAPTNRLAHTQNDSDLSISPTIHQSDANLSLVTTNVEIHI